MLMINEQWESVESVDNIVRVIDENLGREFTENMRVVFRRYGVNLDTIKPLKRSKETKFSNGGNQNVL